MNILQTIWNLLISENELITNMICSPLVFIESFLSALIFTTSLNFKPKKKQMLIYIIVFSLFALVNIFFIPTPHNTFINLIICPLLIILIFKVKIFKAILAEIISYATFSIIGLILVNQYIAISNSNTACFISIPIYKLIYSFTLYFIVFLIYLFIKKNKIMLVSYSSELSRKNTAVLLVNFVVGIIVIAIQSYLVTIHNESIPNELTIGSILIFMIYFFITMFSLSRTIKLEETTQNLEQEKLYNKTLSILYDDIRGFKHDFNNIVQAIGGYVASNNLKGLSDYYSDLLLDCQKANNLSFLNPELINNPAIYSLLTSKYHKADELGIETNMEITLDLSTINMKTYELSKVLGILLDNAIEAANDTKDKKINIYFRKDSKANRQLIIIENSYANKTVDTNKIFEKGYTSKSNDVKNHGLGLWEVRQILKSNNNLNLYTSKNDKCFSQQLEIY